MSADIRGDEVLLDGYVVATLSASCPASIRDRFEAMLLAAHECNWPHCEEEDD